MKRLCFLPMLLFIVFPVVAGDLGDEYKLTNVPEEYVGTYIPLHYDITLKKTRSHCEALSSNQADHDILLLSLDKCYSNKGFHDSYAIKAEEFKEFGFFSNTSGKYIIDKNGNSYRRISESPEYLPFYNYVLAIIFEDAVEMKNVSLDKENGTVFIDGEEYDPTFDRNFFETEDVSLWLSNKKHGWCALKPDGVSAGLFTSERSKKEFMTVATDTCVKKFPLFFWHSKSYPDLPLWQIRPNKDDLRYLRNLVFAKHGYTFKDKTLQKLYENFRWYKKNPKFSEDSFSKDEKSLLEDIQRREKNPEKYS